jgi:phenylalanyl-tRNA synthetase alpha chain
MAIKGTIHPLSLLAQQAYQIFSEMGFEIALGPELESEWYNFDALNVRKDHPARDMQDTFWIKDKPGFVLRTHCTSVSARMLEAVAKNGRIPSAFISVGKIFRNEATDAKHEMQFFHVDGCMIGKNEDGISLANLKGVLTQFFKKILGEDIDVRFRPSFFPFTEPSLEAWVKFNGKWMEMGGSGMIHPIVLRNCGLDPKKVQGFAFGLGFDRIAMVKWGIPDVRLFYQGDLRLNQF